MKPAAAQGDEKTAFNFLRWLTLGALLLAAGTGAWVTLATASLSDGMKRRAQLGFHDGLDQPGLAAQLARTPAEFRAVFDSVDPGSADWTRLTEDERAAAEKDSAHDREAVIQSLHRDFLFIPAYTFLWIMLGLRAWRRTAPHSTAVRLGLVVLPLLAAFADVLENRALLSALHDYPQIADWTLRRGSACSWGKWLASFAEMLLLGTSLLRVGDLRGTAVFLRELGGLILTTAGLLGFVAVAWPSFIWNVSAIGALAAFPFFALVFHPDSAWREGCTPGDLTWRKPPTGV